jgi:hypothetical protein
MLRDPFDFARGKEPCGWGVWNLLDNAASVSGKRPECEQVLRLFWG